MLLLLNLLLNLKLAPECAQKERGKERGGAGNAAVIMNNYSTFLSALMLLVVMCIVC